jgi:GntR family transcriptional regulator / MocR family aminotransferase
MHLRDLKPELDTASEEPMLLQVLRLLVREIREGRFKPGEALPGLRQMSEELGVPRYTIIAVMREMEMEGWVMTRPRSGTYVADQIPAACPESWGPISGAKGMPEEPAFELPSQISSLTTISMQGLDLTEGMPDARLAPQEALAKGYQRAIRRHGDDLLGKRETRGDGFLREQLAQHLVEQRGIPASIENLLITRSTHSALALVASTLLPKGGDIAVEDPGNRGAWDAFRSVPDVRLHPVPVDADGIDTAALTTLLSHQSLDILYLTPQRQIPTTKILSPQRRLQIMALARQHDFAILEDDPELEYYGSKGPMLPLASQDPEGRVIHLGSLTQLIASGLGLNYVVAPRSLVDALVRRKRKTDPQSDRILEWTVAELIRDGDLEKHLARARVTYAKRLASFLESVPEMLGPSFQVEVPSGGLACWIHVPGHVEVERWAAECRKEGVLFHAGVYHDFHGKDLSWIRLGFGALEPLEALRALRLMKNALR